MPEPSTPAAALRDEILTRLDQADPGGGQLWPLLVLGALEGPLSLEAALAAPGTRPTATPPASAKPAGPPRVAYLRSITVEGFRGIGARQTLELAPGPGLTLVVGRNGSGKSSFAEALELLLTGDTWRWSQRKRVWRDGWRNLHHPRAAVACELALEGDGGGCQVAREWPEGGELAAGVTRVQVRGQPQADLQSLGWSGALQSYRPFLSYDELGSLIDGDPSKLFDALRSILGLEEAVQAQALLAAARKKRDDGYKQAGEARKALLEEVKPLADPRAERVVKALGRKDWGLDEVASVLAGGTAPGTGAGELELLARLGSLAVPDEPGLAAVAARLAETARLAESARATLAGRARDLAELLDHALRFHARHGDGACPVCGAAGALDGDWRATRSTEVARLRDEAREADQAQKELEAVERLARSIAWPARELVAAAVTLELDGARAALSAWDALLPAAPAADAAALAGLLATRAPALRTALVHLSEAARAEHQRREDRWRPVADKLAAWLVLARQAALDHQAAAAIKQAEDWLKEVEEEVRNQRFAPIAERARAVWARLRQQSNVSLDRLYLGGSATRRRVEMAVTVDGVEGAALGVMSQGELNALALSLFVPRATLPESPFRFMVIDDPVQSMDPARVDGLARVLEDVARERQVVVFTHDDRLRDSLARLGIAARVIEVTRREGSQVELREARDPVGRYVEDAVALAKTRELPEAAARRVVPGLCRLAVEAGCKEAVRRRRLMRGERHAEVEELLDRHDRLTSVVALALFDDPERTGDVYRHLNQYGKWAGDALRACNEGAHEGHGGELLPLVQDVEKLARWLQRQT